MCLLSAGGSGSTGERGTAGSASRRHRPWHYLHARVSTGLCEQCRGVCIERYQPESLLAAAEGTELYEGARTIDGCIRVGCFYFVWFYSGLKCSV